MVPPARPGPALSANVPIRPIIINKPVERIEKTYIEGYRERIVERPTGDTEPLPAFVSPPMEQIQPPAIIVHVASPTSPSGERTYEPTRSPERDTQKERVRSEPVSTANDPRPTGTPERTKRVPEPEQYQDKEPNKKSSPEPIKTIPNNSPDRIDSELFEPGKPKPQASGDGFKKVGKVSGRQRCYDDMGENDIEPVREVFLLRYLTGKHWPGLSKDMERYYEKYYFTRPKQGEEYYARHVKCWKRRTKWIAEHTSPTTSV